MLGLQTVTKAVRGCHLNVPQGSLLTPWVYSVPQYALGGSLESSAYWTGMLRVCPQLGQYINNPTLAPCQGSCLALLLGYRS